MHTNYYKIVKTVKSYKIIIVAPTCFGLHKPSSGSYSLCFAEVTMLISVTYPYMKLWVLWLHMQAQISLYEVMGIVAAYAGTNIVI